MNIPVLPFVGPEWMEENGVSQKMIISLRTNGGRSISGLEWAGENALKLI